MKNKYSLGNLGKYISNGAKTLITIASIPIIAGIFLTSCQSYQLPTEQDVKKRSHSLEYIMKNLNVENRSDIEYIMKDLNIKNEDDVVYLGEEPMDIYATKNSLSEGIKNFARIKNGSLELCLIKDDNNNITGYHATGNGYFGKIEPQLLDEVLKKLDKNGNRVINWIEYKEHVKEILDELIIIDKLKNNH